MNIIHQVKSLRHAWDKMSGGGITNEVQKAQCSSEVHYFRYSYVFLFLMTLYIWNGMEVKMEFKGIFTPGASLSSLSLV